MDPDSFMTIYDHISTRGPARLGIPSDRLHLDFLAPSYTYKMCSRGGKRRKRRRSRFPGRYSSPFTLAGVLRPPVLYGNEIWAGWRAEVMPRRVFVVPPLFIVRLGRNFAEFRTECVLWRWWYRRELCVPDCFRTFALFWLVFLRIFWHGTKRKNISCENFSRRSPLKYLFKKEYSRKVDRLPAR